MDRVAPTKDALRKRISRLLRLGLAEDRSELSVHVLPFLQSLGEVGLIGGAIRDVARAGQRAFESDLDFVIYGSDRDEFRRRMKHVPAIENRFGGFAVHFYRWKVDVWHIDDTWAKTAGHRIVEGPDALLQCTFFDWDSVVFDVRSRTIIAEDDYTQRLRSGIMDIRLKPNPNPAGSVLRALRRAAHWNVKFGPNLTEFTRDYIAQADWNELVALDERAFSTSVMKFLNRAEVLERLGRPEHGSGTWCTHPVPGWKRQIELPFSEPPALSPHGL